MKDMFANYDNDYDKSNFPHKPIRQDLKILESLDNISIVKSPVNNELGIQVKHNTAFNLYLYLDGWVENSSIDALIAESTVSLKVFSFRHKLVFEKSFVAAECFNFNSKYLRLQITADEASLLDLDSYKMNISLSFSDGQYELFTESDGLLIIK